MHFLILNSLIFDIVQVIPGYVYGAFDITREILYAPWSLVFLRKRTLSDGYSVERALDLHGKVGELEPWLHGGHPGVFSPSYLVSASRGDREFGFL